MHLSFCKIYDLIIHEKRLNGYTKEFFYRTSSRSSLVFSFQFLVLISGGGDIIFLKQP